MTVTANLLVTVRIVNALNHLPESILITSNHKTSSASGEQVPHTTYRGSAPRPRWVTTVCQNPCNAVAPTLLKLQTKLSLWIKHAAKLCVIYTQTDETNLTANETGQSYA